MKFCMKIDECSYKLSMKYCLQSSYEQLQAIKISDLSKI
jgi:hypothetical protein